MLGQWRLISDPPTPGALNMARDEAILQAVGAGDAPCTLRFYDWQPPCLSLGRGQSASDADFERAAALGWDVVRRPTGGRAVLHIDELTYSVCVPDTHPLASGSVIDSYRRISLALVAALENLGLSPRADQRATTTSTTGAVCFETPSHYEVTASGRKLIGSAQMRRHGGLLQHGAFPLRGDLGRICDVLAFPNDARREQAKRDVRDHATTLAEVTDGETISRHTMLAAVVQGFEKTFTIEFTEGALTPSETECAERLYREVYASDAWTRRR